MISAHIPPWKKKNNLILYIPREEIAKCEQAAKGGKFRLGKHILRDFTKLTITCRTDYVKIIKVNLY